MGTDTSCHRGSAPFTLENAGKAEVPVLVAVPHAGRTYPAVTVGNMRDPEFAMKRIEDRHVDLLGRKIAAETGAALLVAHTPRALIDLNRTESDIDWGMVEGGRPPGKIVRHHGHRYHTGLGLVPRRLQGLGEIWRKPLEADDIMGHIVHTHRPYHEALATALRGIRKRWGAALLLDLHSMPPLRGNGTWEPAHFVIGDRFGSSCDAAIPASAFAYFARSGVRVAHNRPYAGGYVLDRHGLPARGLHAIQLEVDRSLYLDQALDMPQEDIGPLAGMLAGLVRALAASVADLANAASRPAAAE